jgi:hypothetical protein
VLAEAVTRNDLPGVSGLQYCFDYIVRLFLDSLMHTEKVTLTIGTKDLIADLPGPDELNHRALLQNCFGTSSVKQLMTRLKMKQSCHLLLGIACLGTSKTLAKVWTDKQNNKRKFEEAAGVAGKFLNVAGRVFQTQTQFLEGTCALSKVFGMKINNPHQPIWQAVTAADLYISKDKDEVNELSQ